MLCLLLIAFAGPSAEQYKIDPVHYYVGFTVRHFSVGTVRARFNKVEGFVQYDPANLADFAMEIKAQANSLDSNDTARDKGLISPFWLDAEAHPEVSFVAKRLEKSGDAYRVSGDLTLKGVTREVAFTLVIKGPVDDPLKMTRLGVEAAFTINRQNYGMKFERTMKDGGPFVGNEMHIEVSFEAIR